MSDPRANLHATLPPFWGNVASLSDTVDLAKPAFAIRSAVAGSLKVTNADGTTATLAFTAGETRPAHVVRLWSTGTTTITASDLEVAYQG